MSSQLNKADRARIVFIENKGVSRQEMVKLFMEKAGLTAAGASTYYTNISKEYGGKVKRTA